MSWAIPKGDGNGLAGALPFFFVCLYMGASLKVGEGSLDAWQRTRSAVQRTLGTAGPSFDTFGAVRRAVTTLFD